MSGRDDESCDITRHHAIGSGSGSGAGGVRCHSTKGVAEERRGGGSGRQAEVGSGSGRRAIVGSVRGSPYTGWAAASAAFLALIFLQGGWKTVSGSRLCKSALHLPSFRRFFLLILLFSTPLSFSFLLVLTFFIGMQFLRFRLCLLVVVGVRRSPFMRRGRWCGNVHIWRFAARSELGNCHNRRKRDVLTLLGPFLLRIWCYKYPFEGPFM